MKALIALVLILSSPLVINAGEKEMYLRRVSLLLRGVPPKFEELESLHSLNNIQFKKYLSEKISEYSDSDLFNEKMRIRMLELLRLKITPGLSPQLFVSTSFFLEASREFLSSESGASVLDQYLIDLFKFNKNWNMLLTGQSYTINLSNGSAQTELDYYQDVVDIKSTSNPTKTINIEPVNKPEKQALAGIITTPRFFERYFSTSEDKNRTRAAALFRIFLCDNTQVSQKFIEINRQNLIHLALNIQNTEHNPHSKLIKKGETIDSKLDLLGHAFDQSILKPNPEKILGRLSYKTKSGNNIVDIAFENMNQMAQAIVKQKQFLSCQTDHFWNWFVGENVKNVKKNELMRFFDMHNRQPKELIKKILLDNFDSYRSELSKQKFIRPTFKNSFNRSLQNFDFYESLKFQFNLGADFIFQCKLAKFELSSLGLVDPQTGLHSSDKPTIVYYQLLSKCSQQLLKLDRPAVNIKYTQNDWIHSSTLARKKIVSEIIKKILGNNLYSDARMIELTDEIFLILEAVLNKENQSNNLTYAINVISSYVVLTPEFLIL